jgi:hypothetical protein
VIWAKEERIVVIQFKRIKTILVVLAPFLVVAVIGTGVFVRFYLGYTSRFYQERCVECNSQEVIQSLEKVFGIKFPVGVTDINTAKSIPIDGAIHSIVRFRAKPIIVEKFFESFHKQPQFELYGMDGDRRNSDLSPVPNWFDTPIQDGNIGIYTSANYKGYMEIYIDTSDEETFIVYLKSLYPE